MLTAIMNFGFDSVTKKKTVRYINQPS